MGFSCAPLLLLPQLFSSFEREVFIAFSLKPAVSDGENCWDE